MKGMKNGNTDWLDAIRRELLIQEKEWNRLRGDLRELETEDLSFDDENWQDVLDNALSEPSGAFHYPPFFAADWSHDGSSEFGAKP